MGFGSWRFKSSHPHSRIKRFRDTPAQFDFFSRHPGGFDRQFFASQLVQNILGLMNEYGLEAEQVQVLVVLDTGEELKTIGARLATTWVAFDTEEAEVRIVPNDRGPADSLASQAT